MFHVSTIKNWFKGKAADFNKIVEYLNNLCGSGPIVVSRPDKPSNGSPPTISIDIEKLKKELGTSYPQKPNTPKILISGVKSDDAMNGINESTVNNADFSGKNSGLQMLMLTRACPMSEEAIMLYFRTVTISKNGKICNIGEESEGIAVYPGML